MRLVALALFALAFAGAGCKKKTETSAPSADVSTADRDRLQGTWGVETFDDGRRDKLTDAERASELDEIRQTRFRFAGDKMVILDRGHEIPWTFVLDETQTPKVLKLTSNEPEPRGVTSRGTRRDGPAVKREPEVNEWIYKFEGDTLVLALTKSDDKRPTEFKARAAEYGPNKVVPGVTVVTLKKTDVPPKPVERTPTTTRRTTSRTTSK